MADGGDEAAAQESKSKGSVEELKQTGTDELYHASAWEYDKYFYKWTILDFVNLFEHLCDKVRSPSFDSGYPAYKWFLRFYPRGEQGCKNMGLYLHIDSEDSTTIDVRARFGIINDDNCELHHRSTNWQRYIAGTLCRSYGFREFVGPRKVFRDMLCNGNLTFYCEFTTACVTEKGDPCESPQAKVLCDFSRLLESKTASDVDIVTCEGCIPAHTPILAARNATLRAMLCKERQCGVIIPINMKDFKIEAVKAFLSFLYLGYVPNLDNVVYDVLCVASKFKADCLMEMCKKSLYRRLSTFNYSKILLLAEHYQLDDLKSEIFKFIQNFAPVINPQLLDELKEDFPDLFNQVASLLGSPNIEACESSTVPSQRKSMSKL